MCCDIKSGLFGVSLKLQCFAIGSIQAVRFETWTILKDMILFLKIVQKIILDYFQASSIALIVAASLMLHQPEKYITEWKNMKKSDTVKEMQINEVGENGIERKLKTNESIHLPNFTLLTYVKYVET